jgi:hypothetical protein
VRAALVSALCLVALLATSEGRAKCPAEMVRVQSFCVDRWEASLVDLKSGRSLSLYYPPNPKLVQRLYSVWEIERRSLGDAGAQSFPVPEPPAWQKIEKFSPRAVSRSGVVPSGYLSYYTAKTACTNAGKRLCSEDEWKLACRGRANRKFPYGANYEVGRCNVFRALHAAAVLHGNASIGLTDPRLNLVIESGKDPLLRLTGATSACTSRWDDDVIYDMVGNLDEWIEDPSGVFVGGFYARSSTKGCDARIEGHAAGYYDYSTGTRCCKDAS